MSQRSRQGGGGRRPKDVRRAGPGKASPPPNRASGSRVQGGRVRGGTATRGRGYNPRLLWAAVVGGALVFAAFAFGVLGGGGSGGASPTPGGSASAAGCPTSQPASLSRSDTRTVTIDTPKGSIVILVKGSLSPIATGNFVALASCGYYDGVVFHRTPTLASGAPFVIQGGDGQYGRTGSLNLSSVGQGGPGYTIQDEPVTTTFHRGTVAMARSSQPNSEGSQFFIVLSDSAASVLQSANPGYAILGEVQSGMNVADAIYQASGGQELPQSPIPMTTVTVANPAAPSSAPGSESAASPAAS